MSVNIFCHLKVHSDFTLARSASSTKDLIARAKDIDIPAFALTDTENMFDALNFSTYSVGSGVQPIMACQYNLMDGDRKNLGQFQLYAMNEEGYINLCRLVRLSHEPYMVANVLTTPVNPMLSISMIKENNAGLICLTGGGNKGLMYNLLPKKKKDASEILDSFHDIFKDRLYIEICRNGGVSKKEADTEDFLYDYAVKKNVPLVATTDIWYATPERHDAWLLMDAVYKKDIVMIQDDESDTTDDVFLKKDKIVKNDDKLYYMRTPDEMQNMFADLPEAFENAKFVALRCHHHAHKRKPILPPFECEGGRTEDEELRSQSIEGLKVRLDAIKEYRTIHNKPQMDKEEEQKYWDRLDFELSIIENMGFPGYFLIVSDFIKWSKMNDIPVGPGRGSGAGSIVAWALMITDLDPLEYGLLFERFLNPERVSMPDFDVDFCKDGREKVIEYVKQKYGSDKVAMIRAFGQVKSKTALSDMQRVLIHETKGKIGFSEVKKMTAAIPKDGTDPMKLKKAYEESDDFRAMVASDGQKLVFRSALKIEGLHRNKGAHAAGIVIGDRPIDNLVPVSWDSKFNMPVAAFDGKGVEASGLVKFDFLGLKNLSVIKLALKYINKDRKKEDYVDISKIDMHDEKVFEQYALGHSVSVFQFESGGMQDVLKQMKPTRFEDLIAAVALYRPGPMAYIPDYARCKNGFQEPKYPMPEEKTKPFLEETYGIMVYQEQVMQVAQACAGYSLGGADLLRRAMGKKIHEEMIRQKEIFINGDATANPPVPGAVKLGMSPTVADRLFEDILAFANYGFNKSHAAAYALVSYQTMWLKVHYPLEFMSATLSYLTDSNDKDKNKVVVNDLRRMGIPLLPPDINKSMPLFVPEYGETPGIRFGLKGLNGFSNDNCDLSDDREQNGPYKSISDFYIRVGGRFNKEQLGNLAKAGGFDSVMEKVNRRQAYETLMSMNEKKSAKGQAVMGESMTGLASVMDWESYCKAEFDAVGYYFKGHPADEHQQLLMPYGFRRLSTWVEYMNKVDIIEQYGVRFCAVIADVKLATTSVGNSMIKMKLEESNSVHWVVMFAGPRNIIKDNKEMRELYETLVGAKEVGLPMLFECKVAIRGSSDLSIMIDKVEHIDTFKQDIIDKIVLKPKFEQMLPHVLYGLTDKEVYKVMRDACYLITDTCEGQPEEKWIECAKDVLEDNIEEVAIGYIQYLKDTLGKKSASISKDAKLLPVVLHSAVDNQNYDVELSLPWSSQTKSFFVASHVDYMASYKEPVYK